MSQTYKEQVEQINKQIKELVGIYRDAVKHLDISESEFWIWYTLVAVEGEHTQQDICSMWSLPKQTVNSIVSRMARKKRAQLERVDGKRTHKVIRLTEEGRRYGENLILPITRAEEMAFGHISPDGLARVAGVFAGYIDSMREALEASTLKLAQEEQ